MLRCLRCYRLRKWPWSLPSSHPLEGLRECLLSYQNIGSTVWELGTTALPTEQGESGREGYTQLPCHLGHRGAGTLIPSAQRFVWAAKQPLGNAALGALFA